ncbi:hypothetical protein GCM10007160_20150 [Litchfieldella qijiaojingensis]|uniref:Outer membrane protein domain-containing protein n=1 Tax=Litchfieldella qijiaojingensis TaxID=980347 RepID=A0ABQ2YR44_9GAMM|nr:hypothetical protein [Halomonas qijiaojingensis]GGX92625.1 hypothetical protein GCM10007160_20150 [Halomonas qijiaojingensis]
MMKKWLTVGMMTALLGTGMSSAHAFESNVTVGALAGTTGVGAEASWRFHERVSLTANYAGGLSWDGDYESDDVTYEGDLDISAGALKLDFYPFAGRFYLTAGAMFPDMEANVIGRPTNGGTYELNGQTYNLDSVHGKLTIADGVQPYVGLGWRSSHRNGFGFFSELGVMATNIDVSLSASGSGTNDPDFQENLRAEERELEQDADKLSVYPVAVLGISYTF